jgi:hypothetical protein
MDQSVDTDCGYEIMTSKQVASYLKISPRSVYSRWEKLGGIRIGRTIRFRKEVIDALFRPEKKQMEGGDKAKPEEIHKTIKNKGGSNALGKKKTNGARKPTSGDDSNRHGLVDILQRIP